MGCPNQPLKFHTFWRTTLRILELSLSSVGWCYCPTLQYGFSKPLSFTPHSCNPSLRSSSSLSTRTPLNRLCSCLSPLESCFITFALVAVEFVKAHSSSFAPPLSSALFNPFFASVPQCFVKYCCSVTDLPMICILGRLDSCLRLRSYAQLPTFVGFAVWVRLLTRIRLLECWLSWRCFWLALNLLVPVLHQIQSYFLPCRLYLLSLFSHLPVSDLRLSFIGELIQC